MRLLDCHTHTCLSPDGVGTLQEMHRRAKELDLQVWAVTEHVEMNRFFGREHYSAKPRNAEEAYHYDRVLGRSLRAVAEMRRGEPVCILLCGMEMGQANADFALSEEVQKDPRLDFVLASLHELKGEEDFYFLDYRQRDPLKLLERYFLELLNIARWNRFDALGHLTYPLRYIEGEAGIRVDLSHFSEQIDMIFRTLIQNGKGLELNTSGFRQKYGKAMPTPALLKRYRELGGEILTIGSDAHQAADLAKGIPKGLALAEELGFRYVTYFEKREPHFVPID